jgi:hypothetical protein
MLTTTPTRPETEPPQEPTVSVPARVVGLPRPQPVLLFWFGLAVLLVAHPATALPESGLDNSWGLGINLAAARHLRFGHDIVFTHGPWGYLDWPLNLTGTQSLLGFAFLATAAAALFLSCYACLRRRLQVAVAAPIAGAVTAAVPAVARPSGMLVVASVVVAVLVLYRRGQDGHDGDFGPLPAIVLGTVGAVLLQVKINNGAAILLLAFVLAVCVPSWRAALTGIAVTVTAGGIGFVGGWFAAHQRLGDIGGYLRGSLEISAGYRESQAVEAPGQLVGYLAAGAFAVVIAILLIRLLRQRVRVATVGIAVIGAAMLELGFQHGFIRHDPGHEVTFFLYAGAVLIALAAAFRRHAVVLAAGLCAILMVPTNLSLYDPLAARNAWRAGLELVLDKPFRQDSLLARQQRLRDRYQLPPTVLAAATGHPVQVDPWETSVAWAYDLDWRPVPVFLPMSAYTPYLDQLNADTVREAAADQVVLEMKYLPIDGRNARWETPRYLLALACDYTPVAADGVWMALRHGVNRCGLARNLGSRPIAAGETVDTPAVGPDEILVTHFTPTPENPFRRLTQLVLKDWSPITVRADGNDYRVPQSLVDGPLLTKVPASLGWTQPFVPFSYPTLGFNHAGTVTFEAIPVR